MILLVGGPAAGVYAVKRAPVFLRAVVNRGGGRDVLDQLDDEPKRSERISVYVLQPGSEGEVHIKGTGGITGFWAMGIYHYRGDVDGEPFRDTRAWRIWTEEERQRMEAQSDRRERAEHHALPGEAPRIPSREP